MCAGDDAGKIWVYDVGEGLACASPDEWGKFAHTLQDIRANKARTTGHRALNLATHVTETKINHQTSSWWKKRLFL